MREAAAASAGRPTSSSSAATRWSPLARGSWREAVDSDRLADDVADS